MVANRRIATPEIDAESDAFWLAAGEGRLLLPECGNCGRVHWYPRKSCPFCASNEIGWTEIQGSGSVYSCTRFGKGDAISVIAYIELDEGPRLLTNIETEAPWSIAIGQRVHVVFVPSSDEPVRNIPFFAPVTER